MEEEREERINFATAKSLFQKESPETNFKRSLSSSCPKPIRSLQSHDLVEGSFVSESSFGDQNEQTSVIEYSCENIPERKSMPLGSSTEARRTNFVIPQKRGDTSDLKWLMTVHNSKPLGLHSTSAIPQSDSKTVQLHEGFREISKTTSPFDDNIGNSMPKKDSDIGSIAVPSNLSIVRVDNSQVLADKIYDGKKIKHMSAEPVTYLSISNNAQEHNKTSIITTLNPSIYAEKGIRDVEHSVANNAEIKVHMMSSSLIDEIKIGRGNVSKQQYSAADTMQHKQDEAIQQSPEALKLSDSLHSLHLAPNLVQQTEVTRSGTDTANLVEQQPMTFKDWNLIKLMEELYKVTLHPERDISTSYINLEGYLEKLPISKTKDTFLKTWKRRFFKLHNGTLHYYESVNENKESGNFKLDGGQVEDLGDRILGVEDGRGHCLILRCSCDVECADWKRALQSQTTGGSLSAWVKPYLKFSQPNTKRVIVLELGSCSIRAGILGTTVALPQVFLPAVTAIHRESGKEWFSFDALSPDVRAIASVCYPVKPSAKVDKYSLEWDSISGLFQYIFDKLNVEPSEYSIMFITPASFCDRIKAKFMDLFINHFKVMAVSMASQAILSLYSYNATSGVVVDIGDRIEILPVADGYVVENGVTRVPYGGQMITNAVYRSVTNQPNRLITDAEFQIFRLTMEKFCYVSSNFDSEMQLFQKAPERFGAQLSLDAYCRSAKSSIISTDLERFQSPEGLFNTSFWGLDGMPIHEMIQKAIQSSPIDMRRQMWRSIFLSGGVTMLKGFPERLQKELTKLVPSAVVVQVHAAPNRYHSSFIGASVLALMTAFEDGCITSSEWQHNGPSSLQKWKFY